MRKAEDPGTHAEGQGSDASRSHDLEEKHKHSGFGIASLSIGILGGVLAVPLLVIAEAMKASSRMAESAWTVIYGSRFAAFLLVVAIGFGFAGLLQKERKKLFGILGSVLAVGLLPIVATPLALGRPRCQGTAFEELSSAFDQHFALIEAFGPGAIGESLARLRAVETEWSAVGSSVPASQADLAKEIDDRIKFARLGTLLFAIFMTNDPEGKTLAVGHLEEYGINEESVVRAYAALPERFLVRMESVAASGANEVVALPRSSSDFWSVLHKTTPSLWGFLFRETMEELRQEIGEVCSSPD